MTTLQGRIISNVFARSGAAGGGGGKVEIKAGGSVTANSTNIRVEPMVSGNGGTIKIEAGTERLSKLVFHGDVDADAKLIGKGGTIELINYSDGILHVDGKNFTARAAREV